MDLILVFLISSLLLACYFLLVHEEICTFIVSVYLMWCVWMLFNFKLLSSFMLVIKQVAVMMQRCLFQQLLFFVTCSLLLN